MIDHDKIRAILAEPEKEHAAFKAAHEKRMARLEKKKQKLREEYDRLMNLVYGVNVKMTVL